MVGDEHAGEPVDPEIEVTEVVPGEYDVTPTTTGTAIRVLVPPGVGMPGIDEQDLAGAIVAELIARGGEPHGTIDVAQLLRGNPGLLPAAAARVDDE
jgi:hypothetical protein